jgi:hypothetical protein
MRPAQFFTTLCLFFALCASATAQTTFFVDPTGGNNGNTGSEASPFLTLTFALTQATAGDSISLQGGNYTGETLPIALKDQVDVGAVAGETPVFDGSGAAAIFTLAGDITGITTLSGVDITDCIIGVSVVSGQAITGLVIDSCNFSAFTNTGIGTDDGYGIRVVLDTGSIAQTLAVTSCTFAGAAAMAAISIELDTDTTLASGNLSDNTCSGGVDRGIEFQVLGGSTASEDFELARNFFSGHAETGFFLRAAGVGGGPGAVSTLSSPLFANRINGADAGETGLRMSAEHGLTNSEGAVIDSICEFNLIEGNDINIELVTNNDGTDQAQILCDFYGNVIRNGTRSGVEIDVTLPNPGTADNEPNFGPGHTGRRACINTFSGNGTDFRLGAAVDDNISAQFNFFPAGNATQLGGIVDASGVMSETLTGSFGGSFTADTAGSITLTAGAGSAFVDYWEGGNIGQVAVTVGGDTLAQADIEVGELGADLLLRLPALTSGNKTVVVTNPGGQEGTYTLTVGGGASAGGGASSSGEGCFVATAAYGEEDAFEVLTLRRFRDHYLRRNPAGREFISWYYREGPKGADWLREHDTARQATRVALMPVAVAANGLTTWNPGQRFGVVMLLLGASFALLRRR